MKQIGWIDFSPDHRKRVAAVIDLLGKEGMVDELGIGTIRDSLSNWLFPGISTIQTRAKYFLIIPRIIRDYQIKYGDKRKRPGLSEYLREQENDIIWNLAKKYEEEDEDGIIGITTAKYEKGRREIVRKPSTIYWNGMVTHNIIRTPLTHSQYLRRFDRPDQQLRDLLSATDEDPSDDIDAGYEDLFGLSQLPEPVKNWKDDLSIKLNLEEAEFLWNHFKEIRGSEKKRNGNLLRQLLRNDTLLEIFLNSASFQDAFEKLEGEQIPGDTRHTLRLAYDFDRLIYGAHIRYNCMLQARHGTKQKHQEMEEKWSAWIADIMIHRESLDRFDINGLLDGICITTKGITKSFVRTWIKLLRESPEDTESMDKLVKNQENWNKRGRPDFFHM